MKGQFISYHANILFEIKRSLELVKVSSSSHTSYHCQDINEMLLLWQQQKQAVYMVWMSDMVGNLVGSLVRKSGCIPVREVAGSNLYMLLHSPVLRINRTEQGLIFQYKNNMTEWDIGSWW